MLLPTNLTPHKKLFSNYQACSEREEKASALSRMDLKPLVLDQPMLNAEVAELLGAMRGQMKPDKERDRSWYSYKEDSKAASVPAQWGKGTFLCAASSYLLFHRADPHHHHNHHRQLIQAGMQQSKD